MGTDNGTKDAKTPLISKDLPVKPDGMPLMKEEDKTGSIIVPIAFTIVSLAIGVGIAYAIYAFGATELYVKKISTVAEAETYWLYLALVIFGRMVTFVNFYPAAVWKSRIMFRKSGNLRSNPFIYRMIGDDAAKNVIIFEGDGDIGAYNRANRSIHHMVENFGGFVAGLFLVGIIFPFPTFVLVCLFSMGRIAHQVGYTTGYGGHGLGFALATIADNVQQGLALIVALKCLF
mmetsp:Transcript_17748/g.24767  ORF Transcript_17748/g.24767 Transcript_17748/m.24767 type:complete len:232 (+) Transcript_17748:86-781(+)